MLVLLLSVVALYANRVLFDSDQFANHVGAAVEEPAVKDEIGRRITDGIVDQQPDLVAVRPVIEGVAGGVVGSGAFNDLLRAAVRDLHRAIFKRDQNTVTLSGTVGNVADSEEAKGATWYVHELGNGTYRRSITLPFAVDADATQATFEHGILRIVLPKAASAKPRKNHVLYAQPASPSRRSRACPPRA